MYPLQVLQANFKNRLFLLPDMTTALAFGTFDNLHSGHRFYLQKAKEQAGRLIVIVARDETVEKVKGRFPQQSEETRIENVQHLHLADFVFLGDEQHMMNSVLRTRPDVICLGYDQNIPSDFHEVLGKNNLHPRIVRIGALNPEEFKSSKIQNLADGPEEDNYATNMQQTDDATKVDVVKYSKRRVY